jgi:hypothetical protein
MDIEGSEVSVLENLQRSLPEECFIFIELHKGDESQKWIAQWAARHGFTFVQVRRRWDAIDGYLTRAEGRSL